MSVTTMSRPVVVARNAAPNTESRVARGSRSSRSVVTRQGCKLKSASTQPGRSPVRRVTGPVAASGGSALALGDLVGELRGDLEQVTDHAEVGELEDRRLGILVDRDDRLRGLHAGPVLDGA